MEVDTQPVVSKTDPSQLCRICLSTLQKQESINIFTTSFGQNNISLHDMLRIVCAPVFAKNTGEDPETMRSSEMPDAVCLLCKKRIVAAYQLHEKCIESDRKLWEIIAVKQELPQETDETTDPLEEADSGDETLQDIKIKIETLPDIHSDQDEEDESDGGSNYSDELAKSKPGKLLKLLDRFTCDVCDKTFSGAKELKEHKLVHGTGLFACSMCEAKFKTKAQKRYHEQGHSEGSSKCTLCERVFARHSILATHMKQHSAESDVLCPLCPLQFHSIRWRDKHIEKQHEDKEPKIKRKSTWTPEYKKARLLEMNTAYRKKRTCKFCSKLLGNVNLLNAHMAKKHSDSVLHCESCEKVFIDQKLLDDHKLYHSTGLEFGCTVCNERFDTKEAHRYHVLVHAGPFTCTICKREFQRKGSYNLHMKRHSGVKPFACPLCPLRHYTKGENDQHMLVHTKEQNHVCDICGSRFTKQDSLIKHNRRVHTDVRPYPCNQCDLKFATSGMLKRHERTHTGEKPFVCAYCGRAYAQSNDLLKHCRIHVGDKPYSCDRCDETYRLMSDLRNHYKVHVQQSGGDQNECTDNDLRFTIMEMLNRRFEREKQRGQIPVHAKMETSD